MCPQGLWKERKTLDGWSLGGVVGGWVDISARLDLPQCQKQSVLC